MANSFTDKYKKRLPAAGDLNWDDEINQNNVIDDIMGAARDKNNRTIWGLEASDGGVLAVDYTEGRAEVAGVIYEIAAGSKTAIDDASARSVNYLYVDDSGVVQISQTVPTGDYAPIAMIDVNAGDISRIGDFRQIPSGLLADETLAEINRIIDTSATVVDVFLYDTSKDSDGGAWRERCSHLSWYQEDLNTATRGATRKFPAVALIVAEDAAVTIYDATDTALPMWMVFNSSTYSYIGDGGLSSCVMLNGQLVVGGTVQGGAWVDFIGDRSINSILAIISYRVILPISGRNNTTSSYRVLDNTNSIVSAVVNDVAVTVLPNAPIDPVTGLPVSTIAVATDAGVSVITDGGDVWDITRTLGHSGVEFLKNSTIVASGISSGIVEFFNIPVADGLNSDLRTHWYTGTGTTIPSLISTSASQEISETAAGATSGLTLLKEDPATPANGMVNYVTKDYMSGWMQGDIKGAWLADTDDTDLVGSELVTNGDFATDTDWTKGTGWSISAGVASCDGSQTGSSSLDSISTSLVTGETYIITIDITRSAGTYAILLYSDDSYKYAAQTATATGSLVFTAKIDTLGGSVTDVIRIQGDLDFVGTIDNVSVRRAVPDRSVNGNGLQVFGTITKTAVATGAELVDYSGFTASNYLEQPYNSDLDFGTGDFHIMGWLDEAANSAVEFVLRRANPTLSGAAIDIRVQSTGELRANITDDGYTTTDTITSSVTIDSSVYKMVSLVRRGSNLELWLDNIKAASDVAIVNAAGSLNNATAVLMIGSSIAGASPLTNGSLALWRMGAGAPSAEQIKHIYETEKHLFQENAACTLSGTSDAVAALAHDDVNDLLYVGTGDGVSVFSGLNRVDYIDTTGTPTSDAVVALSASGGAYIIGNAAEAIGYIPAANLREEIKRQEAAGEAMEVFWFASDTVFVMSPGWKPKFVYGAGVLVEEGVYYDTTFDGFLYTVTLTGAAAAVAIMGVKA